MLICTGILFQLILLIIIFKLLPKQILELMLQLAPYWLLYNNFVTKAGFGGTDYEQNIYFHLRQMVRVSVWILGEVMAENLIFCYNPESCKELRSTLVVKKAAASSF